MATYKYQQNMFGGASEGYVQYNISPDFGTVLAVGETFEITGVMYSSNTRRYGLIVDATYNSGGFEDGYELGRIEKSASAGSTVAFSVRCTVSTELAQSPATRDFNAYIRFFMADAADFYSGAYTVSNASQELNLLKNRLNPVINGVTFADSVGAYEHFGGVVQGKSDLFAALDVELDPLDPSLVISNVQFKAGENIIATRQENISGNTVHLGAIDFNGAFEGFTITVADSKGLVATYYGGEFISYPYQSPKFKTVPNAALAERYEVSVDDEGAEVARLSDAGIYLWANFIIEVSAVNGKNGWQIERSYSELGNELANSAVVLYGADGEARTELQNQTVFPRYIEFSANKQYVVQLLLTDFFESVVLQAEVDKAGGYFNVEKYGVAAGMRSTAMEESPKFESAYPIYAYGGIAYKDLIWENASPGSSFLAQDVYLDLSKYKQIEILFHLPDANSFMWATGVGFNFSMAFEVGSYRAVIVPRVGGGSTGNAIAIFSWRYVNVLQDRIKFDYNWGMTGAGWAGMARDDSCYVPLKIYGIKEVRQ